MPDGIAAVSILAWLAYLASRVVARRGLPELVAFLVVGAALGPAGLKVLTASDLRDLTFATELALAILMFIIGERISLRALRAARWVVPSGVIQYVLSGVVVYVAVSWAGATQAESVLLAALAGAGAPMTVAAVVSSARAGGPYARGLVGTHAVADALAALCFAVALPVAELLIRPESEVLEAVLRFLRLGAGGAVLGIVLGWVIARLGGQLDTTGELLLFVLVHVLAGAVITEAAGLSLPLASLVMGSVASSLSAPSASQRMFVAVRGIEQPLYLIFFALAGASIHLDAIPELGAVGAAYVVARTVGKLAGGLLGGVTGGMKPKPALRLGVDLLPQAGVAVGLAVLGAEALPLSGGNVATVVLGSVVLFELLGPLLVARGLAERSARSVDGSGATSGRTAHDELTGTVLLAGTSRLAVPSWVLDWCGSNGATLVVLTPEGEDDAELTELREQAAAEGVPVETRPPAGENFSGSVIRAAAELDPDLLVVTLASGPTGFASRLVVHPHERIARHAACPVLLVPNQHAREAGRWSFFERHADGDRSKGRAGA